MTEFDGSKPVGLNTDLVADDQPLDTLAEHFLLNEERWHQINSGSRLGMDVWPRKITSGPWTAFKLIPWYVRPALETLTVGLAGSFGRERVSGSADTDDLTLGLRARLLGFSFEVSDTVTCPDVASPPFKWLELDVPVGNVPREAIDLLAIEVRSETVKSFGGGDVDWGPDGQAVHESGGAFPDSETHPDRPTGWRRGPASEESQYHDVLAVSNSAGGTGWEGATVNEGAGPTQEQVPPTDEQFAHPIIRLQLPYVELDSLYVREEYADTIPVEDETPAGQRSPIAARQPYDASAGSYIHSETVGRLLGRERLIASGPVGDDRVRDGTDDWPADVPERWLYAWGGQGTQELMVPGVGPMRQPGDAVELRLAYIGTWLARDNSVDNIRELRVVAEGGTWDLTVEAEQVEAGATPGNGDIRGAATKEVGVDHVKLNTSGVSPFLLQQYWIEQLGSTPGELGWLYREGQLYERDLGLLQLATVRVELSGASTDQPLLLRLEASYNDNADNIRTPEDAALTVVGWSAWEIPQ